MKKFINEIEILTEGLLELGKGKLLKLYSTGKALIPVMEECISFSNDNEKLKHQYSNFVTSYCISKVNEQEIDNFKALTLMKGAYLRSQNNPKVVAICLYHNRWHFFIPSFSLK